MNRTIQIEVNHATGKLLADVEFTVKADSGFNTVNVLSIKSPVTGWNMLGSGGFSEKELVRIFEVCRNAE